MCLRLSMGCRTWLPGVAVPLTVFIDDIERIKKILFSGQERQ